MFNSDEMRKRFHDLGREREAMAVRAKPVRERYEAMQAQVLAMQAQLRPLLDELKQIEAPLYQIDQERGMITRALGGRTGEPG